MFWKPGEVNVDKITALMRGNRHRATPKEENAASVMAFEKSRL